MCVVIYTPVLSHAANKGLQKVQLIGIHINHERMLRYAYIALLMVIRSCRHMNYEHTYIFFQQYVLHISTHASMHTHKNKHTNKHTHIHFNFIYTVCILCLHYRHEIHTVYLN